MEIIWTWICLFLKLILQAIINIVKVFPFQILLCASCGSLLWVAYTARGKCDVLVGVWTGMSLTETPSWLSACCFCRAQFLPGGPESCREPDPLHWEAGHLCSHGKYSLWWFVWFVCLQVWHVHRLSLSWRDWMEIVHTYTHGMVVHNPLDATGGFQMMCLY